MSSKIVFVTGASGLVGSSVAAAFARKGYKVYGQVRSADKGKHLHILEVIPVVAELTDKAAIEKYILESGIIVESATMEPSSAFIDTVSQIAATSKCSDTGEEKTVIWTTGFKQYAFEEKFLATPGIVPSVVRPTFIYGGNGGPNFRNMFFRPPPKAGEKLKIYGKAKKSYTWVHCADLAEAYFLIAQKKLAVRGKMFRVGSLEHVPEHDDLMIACAKAQGWQGKVERTGPGGRWVGDVEYIDPAPDGTYDKFVDIDIKELDNKTTVEILGWKPAHDNASIIRDIDVLYRAYKAWNI